MPQYTPSLDRFREEPLSEAALLLVHRRAQWAMHRGFELRIWGLKIGTGWPCSVFLGLLQVVLDVKSDCPLGAEELGSALKAVGVLTLPLSSNK